MRTKKQLVHYGRKYLLDKLEEDSEWYIRVWEAAEDNWAHRGVNCYCQLCTSTVCQLTSLLVDLKQSEEDK